MAGTAGTLENARIARFARSVVAVNDGDSGQSEGQGLPWGEIVDGRYILHGGQRDGSTSAGIGRKVARLQQLWLGIRRDRLLRPSPLAECGQFCDVGFDKLLCLNDPAQRIALPRRAVAGRDNEYWPTYADEFWPTPGVFDLLSRAEAGLSRSASLFHPLLHVLPPFRCAVVRRNR